MVRVLRTTLFVLVGVSSIGAFGLVPEGISLVGRGSIAPDLLDKSGLQGQICKAGEPQTCVPKSIFGGFGSDVAYTGHDNVFISAPDRGPYDGLTDVPFLDRVHFLKMTTAIGASFPNVQATLLDTRFLKNEFGQNFLGAAGSFGSSDASTLRLDPEGIRVGSNGNFYVSDEYGPYLLEFNRQGHLVQRHSVPAKFLIENPSGSPTAELTGNTSGRQANRGMEGLAISPDGGTLYGIMQNPLLQDGALTPNTTTRVGLNNRILKVDVATGATQEFVYVLEASNRGQGVSEILAINDHEFLVVERDSRSYLTTGEQPFRKQIFRIDISGATDVSALTLPSLTLPGGVVPVAKSLFIDLLDPAFGLQNNDANAIAEKIEALTWGPDLADGRQLLYVIADNDLLPTLATQIFAFAINSSELAAPLNFVPQLLPGPLYAPGQVKKNR